LISGNKGFGRYLVLGVVEKSFFAVSGQNSFLGGKKT